MVSSGQLRLPSLEARAISTGTDASHPSPRKEGRCRHGCSSHCHSGPGDKGFTCLSQHKRVLSVSPEEPRHFSDIFLRNVSCLKKLLSVKQSTEISFFVDFFCVHVSYIRVLIFHILDFIVFIKHWTKWLFNGSFQDDHFCKTNCKEHFI